MTITIDQLNGERRKDVLTSETINLAIDMEATLGAVQAIVYMRQRNVDMAVALRVILKEAERRKVATCPDCSNQFKYADHQN